MIFRAEGKNLLWRYVKSERLDYYLIELSRLVDLSITFKSFTIDGRRGLIQLLQKYYPSVPIQVCHFHMVAIVTRYTTKNPQTECGVELRELILRLKNFDKQEFIDQFKDLQIKYKQFLLERNENNQFQHRRLRSAFRSIKSNLAFLFTYQGYLELNIPNTTNSADGSFSHWKYKVKLHRHLREDRKRRLIDELLGGGK
jgi:hypothetical protein